MSKQKVWFITGASRGFGHRWAEAALKRGDKVAATARAPKSLDGLLPSRRKQFHGVLLDCQK